MNNRNLGLTIGTILLIVAIIISSLLPKPKGLEFLTILLASIAGAYAGYTFTKIGKAKDLIIEMANISMYLIIIPLSMWITPYFLVVGYVWHGIWDLIHYGKFKIVNTDVPEWYIYGCMLFDIAIGIFILIWLI